MTNEENILPESNVDNVAINLWSLTDDLSGQGLVDLLKIMVTRAEEIQAMRSRAEEASTEMMRDIESMTVEGLQREMLDGHFEPQCLKWLLARVFKHLADEFEHEMEQRQIHGRRISRIEYNSDGTVNSFAM